MALAMGWAADAFASSAAARPISSPSPIPSDSTDTTAGLPCVTVPVLSTTTTSTLARASRTSPPRIRTPLFAAREVPTKTEVGVASPRAQGHATTRTLTAYLRATLVPEDNHARDSRLA